MSAEELIDYREGITGSHFAVGGIELMMIPLQVVRDRLGAQIIDSECCFLGSENIAASSLYYVNPVTIGNIDQRARCIECGGAESADTTSISTYELEHNFAITERRDRTRDTEFNIILPKQSNNPSRLAYLDDP